MCHTSEFKILFNYEFKFLFLFCCCNLSVGIALNKRFTTNGMCVKITPIHIWRKQAIIQWSWHVISIVVCCHIVKLCALAAQVSDCNKMVLWLECEGCAKVQTSQKECAMVQFIVKRKGCCCNISVGIVLNVQFTMNGMCTKNNTHIYVAHSPTQGCHPWTGEGFFWR